MTFVLYVLRSLSSQINGQVFMHNFDLGWLGPLASVGLEKSFATKTQPMISCERGGSGSLRSFQWTSQKKVNDMMCAPTILKKKTQTHHPQTIFVTWKVVGFIWFLLSPWHSKLSWWAAWLALESMGSWCRCLVLTLTLSLTQADWIAWKNDQRQGQLRGKRRTWISRINGWMEHRKFDEIWGDQTSLVKVWLEV